MSSLDLLSRDIMWKMIDFSHESILNLRLVSRSIQSQVDEYAMLKMNIPIVKKIQFYDYYGCFAVTMHTSVSVLVPSKKSIIFSLRLQLHHPLEHFIKNHVTKYRQCWNPYQESDGMITYSMNFYQLENERIILKYLRKCIGRQIGIVEVVNYNEMYQQEIFSKLILETKIRRVEIFYPISNESILSLVKEMIIAHNVEQMSISVEEIIAPQNTIINFLMEVSNILLSIEIHQLSVTGIDRSAPYFFGSENSEWARIIIEMFSKKLNKLYIKNEYYPRYLSRESAELLKERLPTIGKSIWFYASCDKYQHKLEYEHNNHSVQVSSRDFQQGYVIVRHCSRINELLRN